LFLTIFLFGLHRYRNLYKHLYKNLMYRFFLSISYLFSFILTYYIILKKILWSWNVLSLNFISFILINFWPMITIWWLIRWSFYYFLLIT